ncbi:MAG: Mu transposase C-terminal domain-containing protein [Candidatus Odinarchaeota archaeon]
MLKIKPLRKPRANQYSTTVYFYSRKLNRYVWCESNLEWDVAILIDVDPSTIDYCEQAIELKWSKSTWIPDFVVLLEENGRYIILIIEVKYIIDLINNKKELKKKYSETKNWIEENKNKIVKNLTDYPIERIEFLVVTDKIIKQSFRIQNFRKFIQASVESEFYFQIESQIKDILKKNPKIRFIDLVNLLELRSFNKNIKEDQIRSTIYEMLCNFDLIINYEKLFTSKSSIFNPQIYESKYEKIGTWFKKYNWEVDTELNTKTIPYKDLYGIAKDPKTSIKLWEETNQRYKLVESIQDVPISELKQMSFDINGKSYNWDTVYQWKLTLKKNKGDIRSLIPKYSKRGLKLSKDPFIEELWEYGLNHYLKMEKKSAHRAWEIMKVYAKKQKQLEKCPSYSTFWRKLNTLEPKEVVKKREGLRNSEKQFQLTESEFPHGDFALQSVQIDHTPIDVLVVDDEHRLVTERPFLTVALDSHTRCVLGYYITYDKPSRLSIAMTLINCIYNKQSTLKKVREYFPDINLKDLEVLENSEWSDVYGLPYTLHMDNGSDFRSDDIRLFGFAYKVHLHYRPVGKTQYGAYVERYLGTLNKRLHGISGTTFSNVLERKDYPSEKRATYTINELEARVISEIVLYHHDFHNQLKTTPISKWMKSFSAKNNECSIDRNLNNMDYDRFKLDILPSTTRTVQKGGISIDNLRYSNKKIEKWIGVKDQSNLRQSRSFRIRFDPRDIRTIFFYDDEKNEYIELKCNDKLVQRYFKDKPLSLWDWRAINKDIITKGKNQVDVDKKLSLINLGIEMDEITANKTKSSRKNVARRQRRIQDMESTFPENKPIIIEEEKKVNPSIFAVKKPQDVKTIMIPPREANPFHGITKTKARQLAKNN